MAISSSIAIFAWLLVLILDQCVQFVAASAFVANNTYNLAVYWGQDSAGHQQRLSFYCQDDSIDIIPLAFLPTFFDKGGLPLLDFANICSGWGSNTFLGTDLANCAFLAEDIQECQEKGKLVLLSLGGANANVGFRSDSQARHFAELIWDLFLGGSRLIRPLGSAVLDGVDLDIESGTGAHYPAFVHRIRSLANGANSKRYYVSAAPQCPFPDQHIGDALNKAQFDFIFVQFYNNYCEVSNPSFNFGTWDHWARNTSPNPNVKVFLGAPGSPEAAGQGYVDIHTLSNIAQDTQNRYPSFGGVMLWDADTAYRNNKFHTAIKKAIKMNAAPTEPSSSPPTTSTSISPSNPFDIIPTPPSTQDQDKPNRCSRLFRERH